MNACRECVFHRVDKDNKYYHWCSKDGENRYNRDNKQVDGYGCACPAFKEKGGKKMTEKYGYCADCVNKGHCHECYRGSWYQPSK